MSPKRELRTVPVEGRLRGRLVFFYIFLVAVLNLGLGFAVAVYLGRRCRSEMAAGGLSRAGFEPGQPEANPFFFEEEEVLPPQPLHEPLREESSREMCVEDLPAGVQQYESRLSGADEELRTYTENPDAAAIQARLDSLAAATEEYLEKRETIYTSYQEIHDQQPQFQLPISPDEQRRQRARSSYPYQQRIGMVVEGKLPDPETFVEIQCHDIAAGGFSFFSPKLPQSDMLVVALGVEPTINYFIAQVRHVTPKEEDGNRTFLVGCKYVGRVSY